MKGLKARDDDDFMFFTGLWAGSIAAAAKSLFFRRSERGSGSSSSSSRSRADRGPPGFFKEHLSEKEDKKIQRT